MYIAIEIDAPQQTIATLNDKIQKPGNPHASVVGLKNLLQAILAGSVDASVKIVVKDAATTINTSGTGSTSETYNLK